MNDNDSATNGFLDNLRGRESCTDLLRAAESPDAGNYTQGWNVVENARASAEAMKRLPESERPAPVRLRFPADEWARIEQAAAMVGMTPSEFVVASANLGFTRAMSQAPTDPQAGPIAE